MKVPCAAGHCEPMYTQRILLIDDEPGFTALLKAGLERIGNYEIVFCNQPNRALRTALEVQPDAILLDVMMPGQDGSDLYREMEAHPILRKIPKIMLTSLVGGHEVSANGYTRSGEMILMAKSMSLARIHSCLLQVLEGTLRCSMEMAA